MNFLNKPGIQNSFDIIDINNTIDDKHVDKEDGFNSTQSSKSFYLIISLLISFIVFFSFVILSNKNSISYSKSIIISSTISDLENKKNMIIKSIENNNNKLNIILSCETEGSLFENTYGIRDDYSYVMMQANNNMHQILIRDYSVTKSFVNLDKILHLINNKAINIEKEIVDNNLVIIGDMKNIKKIFELLEENDLQSIRFRLDLIEYEYNEKFYKLII